MGLKETQSQFVKLSLDDFERRKLYANRSAHSTSSFAPLEKEIQTQARSLINKRLGVVRKILWGTNSFLGKEFSIRFRQFALSSTEPKGLNRHRLDALAFADNLTERTKQRAYPKPLLELLSHETIPVRMWMGNRRFALRFHKHRPHDLYRMIEGGECISKVPRKPVLMLWWQGKGKKRGYFWRELSPWLY
jgi:hypothetical protein